MFDLRLLMILVPALPLAAALVTAMLGPRVLKARAHWPAVVCVGGSFVCSALLLWQYLSLADGGSAPALPPGVHAESKVGYGLWYTLWNWAAIDQALGTSAFAIDITLRADALTCVMLCLVTFVAALVVVFSIGYMHGDQGYWRFFAYVSLFVFSMTMLVSVSNFLLLYVFWEAVGVCSYLLIGFWYEKPEAAAAGKKAFLVNRIGDFGFALGVFLIWTLFETLNFHDLPAAEGAAAVHGVLGQHFLSGGYPQSVPLLLAACLLLWVGACGKSAQFPLHIWLPDAMEGPTPVSALIHAATMVTAGVYLVARCAPLFLASEAAPYVVAAIGGFTALLAALIALTQHDLKRVLAYSTVSQLGYMFLGLGTCTVAGITAGMFHLFTHAFFKALLFLGAGSVMHAMGNVIDMRRFGGLRKLMPVTHATFLVGCLALAGVVPLAGFWSKDAVLGSLHDRGRAGELTWLYQALYFAGLAGAALTAFYTFRAFFRTFYGPEEVPHEAGHHAHESPPAMTWPLIILALCAIGAGLLQPAFAGLLAKTPSLASLQAQGGHATSGFHWDVAALSTLAAAAGIAVAWALYVRGRDWLGARAGLEESLPYRLSSNKFYFDEIYLALVVWPLRVGGYLLYFLDIFLVDGLVNFCGWVPRWLGSLMRPLQVGLVQFYALAMMLGLLVLLGSLLGWS